MQATVVFEKNWNAINAKNIDGSRKYRYIINTGSSRSSKTYSLLQTHYLIGGNTENSRISIWRDTKQDTKNTVLADFKKALPSFDLSERLIFNKTESIYTFPNNSTIEICGGDDEGKVHGFQGNIAHFNEPYKISKSVFDQIDMRTTDYILIDWNPRANHWIDDLSKLENAIVIHSTYKDNPFVPEEQKRKIQSYQSLRLFSKVISNKVSLSQLLGYDIDLNNLNFNDLELRELQRCIKNELQGTCDDYMHLVYSEGLKAEKPNRIYRDWIKILDVEFEDMLLPSYYCLDFGSTNPSAVSEIKYSDGNFFIKERLYKPISQMSNSLPQELESIGIDKKTPLICDSADPLRISELIANGFNAIPAMKGAGSVKAGIDFINGKRIHYTQSSTNLESEYENYEWEIVSGVNLERPLKKDDHILDATRYGIQFMQFYLGIL